MSSVVFSITIVALSLAAGQFGSRLIRIYLTSVRTKLALGLFTMTIAYCLLGLCYVEQDMSPAQVPQVAVTLAAALAMSCVFALLLFLHFVARSMIADEVIRRSASELEKSIEAMPPFEPGAVEPEPAEVLPADFDTLSVIVTAREEGYVEAVDYERMVEIATRHGLVVHLHFAAGLYMCKGGWLAAVYPGSSLTSQVDAALQEAVTIGDARTPTQDLEFSIRHLVDIALRALSPGVNDANTALVVVDHLRGALSQLMGKALPSAIHRDAAGVVRVVGRFSSYGDVLDAALHQIRQAAARHPAVIINLLGALARIAEHTRESDQVQALRDHAALIAAAGLRGLEEARDREDISRALDATQAHLDSAARGSAKVFGGGASDQRAAARRSQRPARPVSSGASL